MTTIITSNYNYNFQLQLNIMSKSNPMILLNLQEASRPESGISQHEMHLARGLAETGRYKLKGVAHRVKVTGFPFPVRRSPVPYRYCFERGCFQKWCPFSYNTVVGDFSSDVSIFFANQMPLMRMRGKVIGIIHDLIPFHIPDVIMRNWKWWTEERLAAYCDRHQYLAEHADVIVTDSEFSRQDIVREFGVDAARIRIVYPGVDVELFEKKDAARDAAVKVKYALADRFILYFGTLAEYKNVDTLIKAYARLPERLRKEVPLYITQKSDALAALAQALGVAEQVRFLGFIPEEDKPAIYRLASVSAFLSRLEGFGIPVVEAMAAGTPVIGSTCASVPEVIGDAGIKCDPDDLEAISGLLERLITDDEFAEKMIAKGKLRAREFTWDNSVKQLCTVIDEVIGGIPIAPRKNNGGL